MPDSFDLQVAGVSALAEPARRALYFYVIAQPEPVSRDLAATGTGLPRHSAKFHLDRLVQEGLLETEFRRLTGRRGPGAGRPSKLYRRSTRQIAVTLPQRNYDLAGQVLARAIEQAARDCTPVLEAVRRAAADVGHTLGAASTEAEAGTVAPQSDLSVIADLLTRHGYEPRVEQDTIVLSNCPFHALVAKHTELVCGMNLDLITAMLDQLRRRDIQARLDPKPDRCCVTLTRQAG